MKYLLESVRIFFFILSLGFIPVKALSQKFLNIPDSVIECPIFPKCGGCQTLDLPYINQLIQKQNFLQALFSSWNPLLHLTQPSPKLTSYRNKILFPVSPSNPIRIGLFQANTHRVIETKQCAVTEEKLMLLAQKALKILKKHRIPGYNEFNYKGILRYLLFRYSHSTDQSLLALITNGPIKSEAVFHHLWEKLHPLGLVSLFSNINTARHNIILSQHSTLIHGNPYYEDQLLNRTFYIGAQSFYQSNSSQAELIYKKIAFYAKNHPGPIWDLYCGIGTISQIISTEYPVIGVESTKEAVDLGNLAIQKNQLKNVQLINLDIDKFLKNPPYSPQLVVVNPPRQGLTPKLIEALKILKPEAILYLSCNPKSFKKNVLSLGSCFEIRAIHPYDMFPHTKHIEVLGYLQKK